MLVAWSVYMIPYYARLYCTVVEYYTRFCLFSNRCHIFYVISNSVFKIPTHPPPSIRQIQDGLGPVSNISSRGVVLMAGWSVGEWVWIATEGVLVGMMDSGRALGESSPFNVGACILTASLQRHSWLGLN